MTISDRDRRLLWARAHNRCAICRKPLTRDERTAGGDVVVADEAHIIARAANGPRGADGDRVELDTYDNLILLCKNDHKMIDDLPWVYTVERLHQIKHEHEAWAESLFETNQPPPEPARVVKTADEQTIPYVSIITGEQAWAAIAGVFQCNLGVDDQGMTKEQVDLAHETLATLQEWSEISGDIEIDGYRAIRETVGLLDALLHDLTEGEMALLTRRLPRRLTGGIGAPTPWHVAELVVMTVDRVAEFANIDGATSESAGAEKL